MPQHNDQRIKLLRLVEILRRETDEDHALTTQQLRDKLAEFGISCDRRTLSGDMDFLNESGFEVLDKRVGHSKAYYMADRSFSDPELKILIDAVQAASFITEKKSAELTEKIAYLGGNHRADILRSNLVHFNTRKHTNESIYYNVFALEQALLHENRVSFRYFSLDEHHQRVYREDGARRTAEPVALIYTDDTYYLICYDPSHQDQRATYRVDRMDQVMEEEGLPVSMAAIAQRKESGAYAGQAISMYGGPEQSVTLRFPPDLLGPIYDRFGENVYIANAGRRMLRATVAVRLSPTFWGWLFQFGNRMIIEAPNSVYTAYREQLTTVRKAYRMSKEV